MMGKDWIQEYHMVWKETTCVTLIVEDKTMKTNMAKRKRGAPDVKFMLIFCSAQSQNNWKTKVVKGNAILKSHSLS